MQSALYDNLKVEHSEKQQEFYILINKDVKTKPKKAVLQYEMINPSYVDLQHTVVPEEFRGHGVAKLLAKAAFDHFTQKNCDILPTCTYLQKFYKENPLPEYKARVKWNE